MTHGVKQREPAAAATPEVVEAPPRLAAGWRIALVVWALAFGGLFLYEMWVFLWKGVGGLF